MEGFIGFLIFLCLVVGAAVILYIVIVNLVTIIPGWPPQLTIVIKMLVLLIALLVIWQHGIPYVTR